MTSTTVNGASTCLRFVCTSLNGSHVGLPQGLYTATPGTQTSYPSVLTGGIMPTMLFAVAPVKTHVII
ncbi:MAG: hypothetical protein U0X76_01580 [Bacteroidia bacterium]